MQGKKTLVDMFKMLDKIKHSVVFNQEILGNLSRTVSNISSGALFDLLGCSSGEIPTSALSGMG